MSSHVMNAACPQLLPTRALDLIPQITQTTRHNSTHSAAAYPSDASCHLPQQKRTGTPAAAACFTAASTPGDSCCWLFKRVPSTSVAISCTSTCFFDTAGSGATPTCTARSAGWYRSAGVMLWRMPAELASCTEGGRLRGPKQSTTCWSKGESGDGRLDLKPSCPRERAACCCNAVQGSTWRVVATMAERPPQARAAGLPTRVRNACIAARGFSTPSPALMKINPCQQPTQFTPDPRN